MGKLAEQDGDRPTIRDDVVHCQDKQVFFSIELHQEDPQERAARPIKWLLAFFAGNCQCLSFSFRLGEMCHAHDRNVHINIGQHDLLCFTFDAIKNGAKSFMAPDYSADGGGQPVDVKGPGDSESANQVISCCSGFQLVEKPKSLLGEGRWKTHWTHFYSLGAFSANALHIPFIAAGSMATDTK